MPSFADATVSTKGTTMARPAYQRSRKSEAGVGMDRTPGITARSRREVNIAARNEPIMPQMNGEVELKPRTYGFGNAEVDAGGDVDFPSRACAAGSCQVTAGAPRTLTSVRSAGRLEDRAARVGAAYRRGSVQAGTTAEINKTEDAPANHRGASRECQRDNRSDGSEPSR